MAYHSVVWHVLIGLCNCLFNLSNFILMEWIQNVLVLVAVVSALAYLIFKWMPKPKAKKNASCGTDCGCH